MMPYLYLLNGAPVFQPPGGGGNWTVNNLTVTGNETVNGSLSVSGALTAPDLTLGSGGPSVKSSLDARASRQGLVFDGTAGSTVVNIPAFGTGDFSFAWIQNLTTQASDKFVIAGAANCFGVFNFASTGEIKIALVGIAATGTGVYATSGKAEAYVYTRSGTTGTLYRNGVSVATITDSNNYTVGCTQIGMAISSSAYTPTGYLSELFAYNRALSASEVVSLFEAGVPSAKDYGNSLNAPSTNAIINAARNSTFTAGATDWAGQTGGSITSGGSVVITPTFVSRVELSNAFNTIRQGTRYRITMSVTGFTAGTDPVYIRGALIGGVDVPITGNGTFTVPDFTANSSSAYIQIINLLGTGVGTNCTFTITSIVVTTLGVLLAPDAAQPGNGLVWTDLSGNGAHIVLPTSGVAWNVPGTGPTRVRGTTSTNGNQLLLGGTSILANSQITRIRLRSRTGTPLVAIGTSAGGAQIVAAALLSTTWQNMTLVLTGGIVSANSSVWVSSNSTDVVEVDIDVETLGF